MHTALLIGVMGLFTGAADGGTAPPGVFSPGVRGLDEDAPRGLAGLKPPARIARRRLRYETQSEPWVVLLGEMAFHAPLVLGINSDYHDVSCQTCHPNGGNNPEAMAQDPRAMGRLLPGRVDLTIDYLTADADNGIEDPRRIPTLRGVRFTAPYTADGRVASLREMVRQVVVIEFGGSEPPPFLLDALIRFLEQLDPLPNPALDGRGGLLAQASPEAHRGEVAFAKPRPELGGVSCATCHPPDRGFADGLSHLIGGQRWDTPALLGLVTRGVYFHDGSARTVEETLSQVERRLGLHLETAERADLLAYLNAIGAEEDPWETLKPSSQMERALSFIPLLTDPACPYGKDPWVWTLTLDTTLREVSAPGVKTHDKRVDTALQAFRQVATAALAHGASPEARAALKRSRESLLATLH